MASLAPAARKPAARPARPAALPATFQTKLEVGGANDRYEREADSVARRVVGGGSAASVPPTITPLGAQCKSMPKAEGKKKEEEKPKPKPKPSAKVQKKSSPPTTKKKEEEKPKPAAKPVQKKAQRRAQRDGDGGAGTGGGMAPASVESSVGRMQSTGAPGLDTGTRSFMESRMGQDFGGVRVHKDSAANSAAQALNARAFTVGNDIFFNRGEYQPHSRAGRELIAHELTHTVQQSGGAARKIQRNGRGSRGEKQPPPDDGVWEFELEGGGSRAQGRLVTAAGQRGLFLPYLNLPTVGGSLKGVANALQEPGPVSVSGSLPARGSEFLLPPTTPRGRQQPANVWQAHGRRNWAGPNKPLTNAINAKLAGESRQDDGAGGRARGNDPVVMDGNRYVLGFANPRNQTQTRTFLFGTTDALSESQVLLIPRWTERSGNAEKTFEADHILELQLGGADQGENLWLLEAGFNGRIGPAIDGRITTDIRDAITAVRSRYNTEEANIPAPSDVRTNWPVTFLDLREERRFGTSQDFWTQQKISTGQQLGPLKFLTSRDLGRRGFRPMEADGTPSTVYIFPTPNGGKLTSLNVEANGTLSVPPAQGFLFPNMEVRGGRLQQEGDRLATLNVLWRKTRRNARGTALTSGGVTQRDEVEKSVDIDKLPGLYDTGYISTRSVYDARTGWDLPGASPVTFDEIALDTEGYLVGHGTLTATKALFPGLRADVIMLPEEARIDFPIPMASFSLGPVTVSSLAMSLGAGQEGLFLRGTAAFLVDNVGHGEVSAEVSQAGPILAGQFYFDTDFFNPASLQARYNLATDEFTISGTLGIQEGRLRGVESASVNVAISRSSIAIDGTVNLAAPLAGSSITVGYTPAEGLVIGGTFPLPLSNVPAVQGATVTVRAARNPETGAWSLSGTGTATLAVPGATGTLTIAYDDGVVTLTGVGAVERGPASGTLNFTATNGAIDEEGNPIEGQVGNSITAWGRGSVSIQFGSIITGTAGIEYTQDNRVIISGEIALPPTYEVFARREYTRDLLHIEPPEFPIWGVSVAGVGVGIFAFVDARISFNAYVGPGEIRNASISATMDLDHPEDATIHGEGQFFVPAYAGLNLNVGGGLRARIAVAYAQGRVGLEGQLGIEADASASVDLDWNRTDGLSIEADFEANARPKFRLLANASVTVGVDLWVTDVSHTFGPWERTLGEFGPDMELGVDFPVRWSEADGLDLSLDNMTIRQPSLDASALMSSVFDRLA